jgi:protein-S-isoprenylcysteine O-methyltransferase Ste14
MGKIRLITYKFLFGSLFVIVIPSLLILWAKYTSGIINLPVPGDLYWGYILLTAGIIFVISGMLHLWIFGKGLPMSAFPPEKFVRTGIYAFTKHPVYTGTILVSFGLSIITQSASGFWMVSPLFILMIVAYVTGFENERTKVIFGSQNYKTSISLPDPEDSTPSYKEKISAYLSVFIPWVLVYETFIYLGVPKDAIVTNLSFEKYLPVWESTEVFYLLPYVFALLIPLITKTRKHLRSFITDLWFATLLTGLIYFTFPFIVNQRAFVPHSLMGNLIMFERSIDGETCALPSFHVIWAFISARYFTFSLKRLRLIWYSLGVLITLSCITTGNHSIPDVIAGFCICMVVRYRLKIWNLIRLLSERLANSWHEWRLGGVRIINHGLYGGAAGFAGMLLAGFFLGHQYAIAGFIIMVFIIIGAGLWAQFIEGSPKLLRPFGYYGGVAGALISGLFVSVVFSIDFFVLLGSFAMAGPWIQAIGRLRCLVQGCCHGKPSDENIGIHFTHPYSRVNKISGLNGIALHPTQLYSIASNLISGMILLRLFSIQMPAVFITGIYLILNGLGRFVEESFRGEAQTPYWAGMRIYQWIAVLNVFIGAMLTTIPGNKILSLQFNFESVFLALAIGLLVTFASGVDFPESNRRFARLTSN